MNYIAPAFGLALFAAATPLAAQESGSDARHLQNLRACQNEADPAARLACYDAAVAALVAAEDAGDLRIVDKEDVRQTRRKLFGFSLPDLGIFGRDDSDQEPEIEEIETTIASVSGSHSTGYLIRTADGAVWRLSDIPRRLLEPRAGDTLLIKNAALSSYFLRINGQNGVKGVRVR